MTGTSKKPPCRCPRCVRRRIQFLTLSGAYIALAAGFYLVIGRSKLAGFPSLDTPAISVREASVVLGGIGRPGLQGLTQSTTPATQQDAEMLQETLGKGDFSAGSLELTKD